MGLHVGLEAYAPPQDMRKNGLVCVSLTFGKDALISNDGANALTEPAIAVAEVADRAGVTVAEEEDVGAAIAGPGDKRVVWALRRRPVAAALSCAGEVVAVPAVASSGQKDAVAIDLAYELPSVYTVECCPFGCAVVIQLLDVIPCGHTPRTSPLNMSHIVARARDV